LIVGAAIVGLGGLLAYLPVVNLARPALDFVLAQQDFARQITTEELEFQPNASALSAPQVPGALEEALRVVLQVDEHAR
jgi:hypothetical protein